MSFPDSTFLEFLYWLINTPGLGGIAVGILGVSIVSAVGLTLLWISRGANEDEIEIYSYPHWETTESSEGDRLQDRHRQRRTFGRRSRTKIGKDR